MGATESLELCQFRVQALLYWSVPTLLIFYNISLFTYTIVWLAWGLNEVGGL